MKQIGYYLQGAWNTIAAIWSGMFLMRIRMDRYFIHILYTFFLFWLAILIGMCVDSTLLKVEKNKDTLNDLKIYHAQKTVQIERINSISKVEELLEEQGSTLAIPQKPATTIKK